jgi:hypothetical protein
MICNNVLIDINAWERTFMYATPICNNVLNYWLTIEDCYVCISILRNIVAIAYATSRYNARKMTVKHLQHSHYNIRNI